MVQNQANFEKIRLPVTFSFYPTKTVYDGGCDQYVEDGIYAVTPLNLSAYVQSHSRLKIPSLPDLLWHRMKPKS